MIEQRQLAQVGADAVDLRLSTTPCSERLSASTLRTMSDSMAATMLVAVSPARSSAVRRASIRMCAHTAQKHSVTRTTGVRTLSQCECAFDLMRVMS
jgi:hypothetical protein